MDLIGQLAGALNVDGNKAEGVAGTVLGLIQKQAPAGALDGLLAQAPEASGWMSKASSLLGAEGGGGGGDAGGLLGSLGGMLGGAGGAAGLLQGAGALQAVTGALGKLGIPPELAARAVPIVLSFLQQKLGSGGLSQLAAKVPFLESLTQLSGPGGGDAGGGGLGGLLGGLLK